jgi:hypothetical protein
MLSLEAMQMALNSEPHESTWPTPLAPIYPLDREQHHTSARAPREIRPLQPDCPARRQKKEGTHVSPPALRQQQKQAAAMVCPPATTRPAAAAPRPCLRAEQVDALLDSFFSAVKVDPSGLTPAAPASAGAALAATACARATAAAAAAPATPPRPHRVQDKMSAPPALRRLALGYVHQDHRMHGAGPAGLGGRRTRNT